MVFKDYLKEQLLFETPLPSDWDSNTFNKNISFKKKIEYATAKAQKIGSGSSRVAFEIEYKGRPTILKIAKNDKGIAQNAEEAKILEDSMVSDIVIPLIDYQEDNGEDISWIHVEKADKISEKDLCKLMYVPDLYTLTQAAQISPSRIKRRDAFLEDIKEFNKNNEASLEIALEYVDKLSELASNFDVEVDDFRRVVNWGLYKGKPVVIDLGFTYYTKEKYYS